VNNNEDKQPKPFADRIPSSTSLFAMPPVVNGELVPTSPFDLTVPTTDASFTAHSDQDSDEHQPFTWLGAQPVTSLALSPEEQAAQNAERDRLLGLCRHLRRTHRCPGQCVLSPGRQERVLREIEGSDGGWS
jgi:hypothetical protein